MEYLLAKNPEQLNWLFLFWANWIIVAPVPPDRRRSAPADANRSVHFLLAPLAPFSPSSLFSFCVQLAFSSRQLQRNQNSNSLFRWDFLCFMHLTQMFVCAFMCHNCKLMVYCRHSNRECRTCSKRTPICQNHHVNFVAQNQTQCKHVRSLVWNNIFAVAKSVAAL